jgi:WD40 repeat protein
MLNLALCLFCAGEPVEFKVPRSIPSIAFSPDGKVLATGDTTGKVVLWNAATGGKVMDGPTHKGVIWALAYSPDGKTLYSGSLAAPHLASFDVESFAKKAEAHTPRPSVHSLSVSPDGATLAVVTDGDEIHLYKADGLKLIRSFKAADMKVPPLSVAFSPDGKKLIIGGQVALETGAHYNTFRVWDLEAGKGGDPVEGPPSKIPDRAYCKPRSVWAGDGKAWAGLCADRVLLVRGKGVTPILSHRATGLAFTPDGATLVISERGGSVRLFSSATGKESARLPGGRTLGGAFHSMALSPDGKRVAIGRALKVTIMTLDAPKKED